MAPTIAASPAAPASAPLPPAAPPPPPPRPRSVQVVFSFDESPRLGKTADLYWLSANATEHLYTSIPAGMQAQETTLPGECWRARDHDTANVIGRYCATDEPMQHVDIAPHDYVVVDFFFPPRQRLAGPIANVYELRPDGRRKYVGMVAQGTHFSVSATAGDRFAALERGTHRPLLNAAEYTVTAELEQLVNLGTTHVTMEFVQPRRSIDSPAAPPSEQRLGVNVFRFGGEHLHATLAAGEALRTDSWAGEQWILRESLTDRHLLTVNATELPLQRVNIPL